MFGSVCLGGESHSARVVAVFKIAFTPRSYPSVILLG